jgi:hypothetical protein
MQLSSAIRAALIALTIAGAGLATAYADGGSIRFNVIKAGFVVGGSGGTGALFFHGRSYPLAIGGVSYGFTFGASAYTPLPARAPRSALALARSYCPTRTAPC